MNHHSLTHRRLALVGAGFLLAALAGAAVSCVPTSSLQHATASSSSGGSGGGSGGGTPGFSSPLTIRPDPVNFTSSEPGLTTSQDISLQNTDPANSLTVTGVTVTSNDAGAFSVTLPQGLPLTLSPGQTVTFPGTFSPPGIASYAAFVQVSLAGSPSRAVALNGTGIANGLAPNPGKVDFGAPSQGDAPSVQRLAIVSQGTDQNRTISQIAISNDGSGTYSLANVPPLPIVVPPNGYTSFQVVCNPQTAGQVAGEVQVTSDDPHRPDIRVPLTALIAANNAPDEFRVNPSTTLDQKHPCVAAVPVAAGSGSVAVALYEDDTDIANVVNGEPGHAHMATSGFDANGHWTVNTSRDIIHHVDTSEGGHVVGYIGFCADAFSHLYYAPCRYHPSLPQGYTGNHPHGVFLNIVGQSGEDDGNRPVSDNQFDYSQNFYTLDIACDPNGGARFVVLKAAGSGEVPAGLAGRLVNRDGGAFTSWFTVSSSGQNPRVAFASSRFLVVWENNGAIAGQLYDASGSAYLTPFNIGSGLVPRIAGDPNSGTFAVTWQGGGGISVRTVGQDGSVGPIVQANDGTTSGTPEEPAIGNNPGTGWLVVWTAPDADQRGIYARKFDAGLSAQGAQLPVNEIVRLDQHEPATCWVPLAGKWAVVWTGSDGDGAGIKGRFLAP